MTLRGGISGFGEVAVRAHLPGWQSRDDIQIVAVHDPIPERRHLALSQIANVRVYEDLDLMLSGERLDFLDVASPPALHVDAARAGLEAGAHVIVEKPLCLNPEAFGTLESIAIANRRVLMCVHNWKYSAAYSLAHEIVASGRLGPLRYIALDRLRTQPAGTPAPAASSGSRWRIDPALGGGILIDHGWHVLYLMTWLMGATPESVSASLTSPPGASIDEMANLRVAFDGGRLGYCHLSWRAPARRTSALLYGDEGILEIIDDRARLTKRSGESQEFCVAEPDDSYHPAWFSGVAREFVAAISDPDGSPSRNNLAEAKAVLSSIIAARVSDRSHSAAIDLASLHA